MHVCINTNIQGHSNNKQGKVDKSYACNNQNKNNH